MCTDFGFENENCKGVWTWQFQFEWNALKMQCDQINGNVPQKRRNAMAIFSWLVQTKESHVFSIFCHCYFISFARTKLYGDKTLNNRRTTNEQPKPQSEERLQKSSMCCVVLRCWCFNTYKWQFPLHPMLKLMLISLYCYMYCIWVGFFALMCSWAQMCLCVYDCVLISSLRCKSVHMVLSTKHRMCFTRMCYGKNRAPNIERMQEKEK